MAWYKEMFADEDPLRSDKYGESEKSRAQVDFVIEKLALQPGARILDLCCGQGRHLLDLMKRGYEVVGVDLSEYMLAKCREVAEKDGLKPNLIEADMREIAFDSEFDAVINLFTSFGYLESDDEDQKVLDAVSRALKPGGRFLMDIHNRDAFMARFVERTWSENSRGDIILEDRHFDSTTGRNNSREITIHADGRRSERTYSLRIHAYTEIAKMLASSALEVQSVWGGWDSSPFTSASRGMLIIAEKART